MMLASNFRFTTEDVDIGEIERPWPYWLAEITTAIADKNDWPEDWINDAVTFHLSSLASRASDHMEFGSFPQSGGLGLTILVPTADYLLALKLKAIRVLDPVKGVQEADDIRHLMQFLKVDDDAALGNLDRYFPRTAQDGRSRDFAQAYSIHEAREVHRCAPLRSLKPARERSMANLSKRR